MKSQEIHCVNPLSPTDTGKVRLVLDLSRTVNPVSQYKKISLGALQDFNRAIQPEDYMGIAEITDAYYHVPVKEAHKKDLGFRWECPDKKIRHYVFNVLVSGSNKAVAFFHILLVPIIAYCNLHGVPVVGYIDDFRTHARTLEKCRKNLAFLKTTLERAGFLLSEKTPKEPAQVLKFLGILNDTRNMIYTRPPEKKAKYKAQIDGLMPPR